MDDDGAGQVVSTRDIDSWRVALDRLDGEVSDAERIEQLRAMEEAKAALCAAQARVAVALEDSVRARRAAGGVAAGERSAGVGAQVALARKESPARGGRLLGFAQAVVREMPRTHAALRAGVINEWRATLLVRESACLSRADRQAFDAALAADHRRLAQLGDRALVAWARRVAYRLDATAVVRRSATAHRERRVTLRPAPDTMSHLSSVLPVAQGVSVYATLTRDAEALRAQGDRRTRDQIMADLLVERVTGQATAEGVPVEVQLVITDRTLLAGQDEPAHLSGYGTVPAAWARRLIARRTGPPGHAEGTDHRALAFFRRLFTHPATGQLVAMDSRSRTAPPGLARFIDTRDQTCRTPWCDAPIRHRDHIVTFAAGGPTTADNLQGLCEACNYAKEAPGWAARAGPPSEDLHQVELITPTGHRYRSTAPPLPGHDLPGPGPADLTSPLEQHLQRLLDAA